MIKYRPVAASFVRPNAFSKARHAASGSQIFGSVDSMKAYMGVESKLCSVLPLNVIAWMGTTRSRLGSLAKENPAGFGTNLDVS